jgi:hypothetical protein
MTENTKEIIKLIIENGNAEEAVMIFAKIIDFLKHHEASEEQVSAFLQENFRKSI